MSRQLTDVTVSTAAGTMPVTTSPIGNQKIVYNYRHATIVQKTAEYIYHPAGGANAVSGSRRQFH